jgi:hypothetical protein
MYNACMNAPILRGSTVHTNLFQQGFSFNKSQLNYLYCLMLESIQQSQKDGSLLSDVTYKELNEDYKVFLALTLAPAVARIKDLE